jgi:hypothetical protein
VRRPGWLPGGSGREEERDEEEPTAGGRRRASEREQREELAKARRERERKARANLAAKARGEEVEREKPKRPAPAKAPKAAREKEQPKGRPDEPKRKPDEREREKPKARKPAARRGADRKRPAPKGRATRPAGVLAAAGGVAKDVRAWIAKTAPRAGQLLLRAAVAFFSAFFAALGMLLNLAGAGWRFVRGPLRAAIIRLDRATRTASRAVTPARALAVVAAGALVLLALSQFADYRTISIGNDSYAPGIQTVAPAPVAETDATGSAHSYLMVPLAIAGLVLLAAALTGRRRLCGAIALIGLAAVLVALLHDRPAGLDTGDRPLEYEGVKATLVGGFYAQIAAGLALIVSSLLLGRELRLASPAGSPRKRPSAEPSRLRLRRRRRPRVQGARA